VYQNAGFGSYIQSNHYRPDEFMGVPLTRSMDFSVYVGRIPGLVGLAGHYRVAKIKDHASFCLDIWARLRFDISSFHPA